MSDHMTVVMMRRTEKMMTVQSTASLRYLASGVDWCQNDVVVPVGGLHPGTLQRGGVRVVEEPRAPVQLLRRPPLGPPCKCSYSQTTAGSGLRAVDQQSAGGAVVGRKGWNNRGGFARADVRCTSASGGRRRVIV